MSSAPNDTAVTPTPESIAEFSGLDDHAIRGTVVASGRPAVLRGLVSHWPVVREARISPAAAAAYLRRFDSGALVDAIMTPPEIGR